MTPPPHQHDDSPDPQADLDLLQALDQIRGARSRGEQHTHVVITGTPDGIALRARDLAIDLLTSGHCTLDTAIVEGTAVLSVEVVTDGQR